MKADDLLTRFGAAPEALPPASGKRFPDGADFRIEVSSVEGPAVLAAIVRDAAERGVVVNRVSQGSGAMVLSEADMREMSAIGADAGLEISLFIGPREEWGGGVQAHAPDGPSLHGQIRGMQEFRYAVEDVLRAIDCGIRGFLIADSGLLRILVQAQRSGEIPAEVVWKLSAIAAPSNPVALQVWVELGASTVNLPSDLSLGELAAMRAAVDVPLDLYVEAPDGMGGIVRGEQIADLVTLGAPMYTKFGLRNSQPLYPAGLHMEQAAILIAREKVHRAQVAMEWLRRCGSTAVQSAPGAVGLGIPVR
ncbi:MAG: hypothetical protein BGO26_15875 [Actinobacteria bacterium 69-20]|jgi:hypothetical protein|nr:U32 family peptidase [Actinomycetota bacterium]OJV28775.1 MAG: hypothetical protein BGO26_15875 [Actinobacteria bacterium 69-20]